MVLNGEEKYSQQKFERTQRKLTDDQLTVKRLERQLSHAQTTINYLNGHMDNDCNKLIDQHNRIKQAINLYDTGERSEGITLDTIRGIMR